MLLEKGDAVLFNHLIVHGSGTNSSCNRRRALLYQIRNNIKKKDHDIFIKETLHRTNFIKNQCAKVINELDL